MGKNNQYKVIDKYDFVDLMLSKHIILPSDIVDVGVKITEEVRDRFTVSIVLIGEEPIYIIKCAKDKKANKSLQLELSAYRYLEKNTYLQGIAPALMGSDTDWALMIIEWISGVNPIEGDMAEVEVSAQLGKLIGRLHQNTLQSMKNSNISFKSDVLAKLRLNDHGEWEKYYELDKHIKSKWRDILADGVRRAEYCWNPDAFMHGDLKWEHFILSENNNIYSFRLIDWELAGFGDSAWDVACIINDIVLDMHYKTVAIENDIWSMINSERIKIFLQNYLKERPFKSLFLDRVSLYLGARLFQTSLELVSVYGWDNKESRVDMLISMSVDIFNDLDRLSKILKDKLFL